MSKKIIGLCVLGAALTVGGLLHAANYTVAGLSFSGIMASPTDSDTLTLRGQEGVNPTICLSHSPAVDFEFEVFNDGVSVARNVGVGPRTCSTVHTPGTVTIRVWTFRGTGPYSVSIAP